MALLEDEVTGFTEDRRLKMGGKFGLDKAHGDVPAHLDHIQHSEAGALKERYGKDGKLIDTRFQPSNSLANDLCIEKASYKIPKF